MSGGGGSSSGDRECPGDSHYDVTAEECLCLDCPEPAVCPAGTRLELLHKGRRSAGFCCDDFGCVSTNVSDSDCVTTVCPQGEEPGQCPADSILRPLPDSSSPTQQQLQKCCGPGVTAQCICKSEGFCPEPSCIAGQKANVTKRGNNTPGNCCDSYTCLVDRHNPTRRNVSSEERSTCSYDGSLHQDGATWSDGNCTECQCRSGLAFCKHTLCARLTCDFPVIKKGECCAVCEGCLAADGISRADSEEWRQDDCVQCRCQNGQIHCRVEECQTSCPGSVKVPGQCCPACNDSALDSIVLQPAHCVHLGKCKKLCKHGYTKHIADGCFRCECQLENCSLTCEFGYETDPITGEGHCECLQNNLEATQQNSNASSSTITAAATSESECQNVTSCNMTATDNSSSSSCHLTRRPHDGCPVCECRPRNSCPEFRIDECPQECPFGYQYDASHCLTCECIRPPSTTTTLPDDSTSTAVLPRPTFRSPPPSCHSSREKNLVPWREGCHECVCFAGRRMCDVILATPHSETKCRPQDAEGQIQVVLPGFCGTVAADAERRQLDPCTECVCTSGVMYCAELSCPILQCDGRLVQKPDQCCPSCEFRKPPTTEILTTSLAPLTVDRKRVRCQVHEEIYESGAAWWDGPCRACRCTDGAVRCNEVQCPVLDCPVVTLQKGRCCPRCFNSTSTEETSKQCRMDDQLYSEGQIWRQSDCLQCTCADGSVICRLRENCDDLDKTPPDSEPTNRPAGKTVIIILAVTTSVGLSVLAGVFLIRRWRQHHLHASDVIRGHHFSPIATSEEPSESHHQDSRSPLAKSRPKSCFSLP
ncbi:Cysteine-rich motor neuron 1 protein [Hypsibius exemplaris]|uniref:Cysteine-rich motor neuron 1 protein n=1 Tax=Hypsibius exemplaris TaxID=2072580 RepID=A0A1W0W9L0_HYPEX|nr:Cysteine-rich motor neuron 1 protein [Hypsibius exemplaris]